MSFWYYENQACGWIKYDLKKHVIWENHMMVQGHIGGRFNVDNNDSGAVALPLRASLTTSSDTSLLDDGLV